VLQQTTYFRPRGLSGRLYWYALLPFHLFIFGNMARRIVTAAEEDERAAPNTANSDIPDA
jgi:hypothetical protein